MKNFNKILFLFTIAAFLFASCSNNSSKKIIGSWDNTKTEVTNFEQVAKKLYDNSLKQLEFYKSLYNSMINDTSSNDSTKRVYQQTIDQFNKQISELNLDSIKKQMTDIKIGTFKFKADSTLILSKDGDSIVGNWSIVKNKKTDTLYITIQNNKIPLAIESISSKKLKLVQNNKLDSLSFDMIYYFDKH